MRIALTRPVSPNINRCELTHLDREVIDVDRAQAQHRAYEAALAELGCQLQLLPATPEQPDSVFVEDTALVLPELAVITRPGADTRRVETETVAAALQPYRKLAYIQSPGTLDGGDILRVEKTLFVGRSERSNSAGVEQLRQHVAPHGYRVQAVQMQDCLHLKTAVTQVGPNTLLVNRNWIDLAPFAGFTLIDVAADEPLAANALWLDDTVIYPAEHQHTCHKLTSHGVRVRPVSMSELGKAEGGVTCCSLIFEASDGS